MTDRIRSKVEANGHAWDPFIEYDDDGHPVKDDPVDIQAIAHSERSATPSRTPPVELRTPVPRRVRTTPTTKRGQQGSGNAPRVPQVGKPQATERVGRSNKAGSAIPTPKVPTRTPKDQAEHMARVFGSEKLKDFPTAHHVAMALHVYIGREQRKAFGHRPLNVAKSLIARMTGLSETTAMKGVNLAVECGYYRRVDGADGGTGRGSAAAYVPVVPDID